MMSPEQLNILLNIQSDKTFKAIRNDINNLYADYCKEIQKLISAFHIDIASYDATDPVHKYLLNNLNKDINRHTDNLFSNIEKIFDENIDKIYDLCYNSTLRSIRNKKDVDAVTYSAIKVTDIDTPWSGIHYKERIQQHNARLNFTLKNNLNASIIRQEKFRKNYTTIQKSLQSQLMALDALAKTEIKATRTQAQLSCYKANDIMYIKNLSGGCDKCSPYVGKRIKVKDAIIGKNVCPFHPRCKCTLIHEEE